MGAGTRGSVSKLRATQMQVPLHQWPADPPPEISEIGKPHNDEVYHQVVGTDGTLRTQCIFLRGYRVLRRSVPFLYRLKLKAAAGPHELPKYEPPSPPGTGNIASESAEDVVVLDESLDDVWKV